MTIAALFAIALGACGSEARAVDACEQLESARCARGPECIAGFVGEADSCRRFYQVQCGRGVQDGVRDPTKAEIDRCIGAMNASCDAVRDPVSAPECAFLVPAPPQPDAALPFDAAPADGETNEAETD